MYLCNTEVSLAFKIIQKKSKWHEMTIQFKLSHLHNQYSFILIASNMCCQHFIFKKAH